MVGYFYVPVVAVEHRNQLKEQWDEFVFRRDRVSLRLLRNPSGLLAANVRAATSIRIGRSLIH